MESWKTSTGTPPDPPDRRVLLVAYEYPPIGGTGMVRPLKFSKYLPRFGWEVHVLTVRNPDRFYTTTGGDPVPPPVTVHRATNPLNNLSVVEGGLRRLGVERRVFGPDVFLGWASPAIRAGARIIEDEAIDLVWVTCPPFSAARIGVGLKERTGVPFVLDLRDAWTPGPHPTPYIHPSLGRRDERLEARAIASADWIVTATPGIRDAYIGKYPSVRDRSSTVLNGFDPDDIPPPVEPFPRFTIAYTGFFYGARSPGRFLAALGRIHREGLIPADEIRFAWAGRPAPFVLDLVRREGVEPIVEYLGLLTKADADALLYRSHLLFLLPFAEVEEGTDRQVLTGKIFPYLASGRPILGLMPDGDAKRMVEEYAETAYIVPSGDVEEICEAILDAHARWKAGTLPLEPSGRTLRFRERYSVLNRTRELAAVFERLRSSELETP
ncbi:MAG: glycosyltransferase family 4 protein [Methanospirillum sp.]|nr:glycosyltransferase family 4 protein [Methanospirillum sp.]